MKNLGKISGISDHSHKIKRGDIFVAIKGEHFDGNDYIENAVRRGASAVVSEIPTKEEWSGRVKYIKVENARKALSDLASKFYGNPSEKLTVIGVTGSDGKTTTSHMIYEILEKAGKKVGLVSSISAKIGTKEIDTGFHVTNPEPLELQKLLSQMVKSGIEYVVLEVTSHGISQSRIGGINFDIAVLTNVTHEHLDYHKTFENYRDTKLKLFLNAKTSILNKDDKNYLYFSGKIKSEKINYSLKDKLDLDKLMGESLENVGEYNLQNARAAAAVAKKLGIGWDAVSSALSSMKPPKGRLEKIKNYKGINLYIDFAHTPNALKQVLTLLKGIKKGRLIAVFGCAGERDVKKRRMMARISTEIADVSIYTAEDPRSEDVNDILKEMERGVVKKAEYYKIPERGEAISLAVNNIAREGDTVVICGKAHEKSMAYNGVEYPWSDYQAVEYALKGKVLMIKR